MRFLVKLVVLGFAGFGAYKAWEIVSPKMSEARERAAGARDKIEPAFRQAADTLQHATKEAADTITEASRDAATGPPLDQSAPDAFGRAAEMVSGTPRATPGA
jgi:hypothetical protein